MAIRMQTPTDPMEETGSKFAHLEWSLVNHKEKIDKLRLAEGKLFANGNP